MMWVGGLLRPCHTRLLWRMEGRDRVWYCPDCGLTWRPESKYNLLWRTEGEA